MQKDVPRASRVPMAELPRILTTVPSNSSQVLIPEEEDTLALGPDALGSSAHLPHRVVAGMGAAAGLQSPLAAPLYRAGAEDLEGPLASPSVVETPMVAAAQTSSAARGPVEGCLH